MHLYDNTVGSRSSESKAYIAGFLDGDGSLMLQLKKRSDSKIGYRFMVTIAMYQDSRHEKHLRWMRSFLRIGYVSKRSDGISELRINGYKQVLAVLTDLQPYIRFKEKQTQALISACKILSVSMISTMTKSDLRKLVDLVVVIQTNNYTSHKKRTKDELYKILGLTP